MNEITIDIAGGSARAESGGGTVLVPLDPVVAQIGVPGLPGPPGTGGGASSLDDLTDVDAPSDTPVGKVLGTTAEGQWGPVDPASGGMSQAEADARYVNADGDTMTGPLTVASHGITVDSPGNAFFAIDRNSGTDMAQFEFRMNGNQDFVLGAKGSGTDRHFRIYTNGKEVDVLRIERSSGHISLLNGTDLTLANEPTAAKHAATKGYVDSRIWKGTQAAYDAIAVKDPTVLYVITG